MLNGTALLLDHPHSKFYFETHNISWSLNTTYPNTPRKIYD